MDTWYLTKRESVSLNSCEHDKVYSGEFFASNPPKFFWICSKCGESDTDNGNFTYNKHQFDELTKKFTFSKDKYREDLLKDDKWIKDLFSRWWGDILEYGYEDENDRDVMRQIIKDKLGIEVE